MQMSHCLMPWFSDRGVWKCGSGCFLDITMAGKLIWLLAGGGREVSTHIGGSGHPKSMQPRSKGGETATSRLSTTLLSSKSFSAIV
jgi:hypothetical protein